MTQTIDLDRSGAHRAGSGIESASKILSEFLAELRYESLPSSVVHRAEEAFLDWFACALAGRGARPVRILEQFAATMGPSDGPSEILISRQRTSPVFAALVNGAASHMVELDDVHLGGLMHPGVIVFPALLAAAQQVHPSGKEFLTSAVAGYEAAIRVGEFLGPQHYKVFHTTGTAGTLGAAVGVARLFKLDARRTQHAIGCAGTQAAGLWEFLRDAADSKPLHSAKASADGLLSAYIARDGFTGPSQILEGKQGMAAGMSGSFDPAKLTHGLGESWRILGCSCKVHACCRHIHPTADALLSLMRENNVQGDEIAQVTAHVHHGAIDVLGGVVYPETVHQSKFSMGFALGLIAYYGRAGLYEFTEAALHDPKLRAFQGRVEMVLDPEIDDAPGNYWGGLVELTTFDGNRFTGRVPVAKGDPQNPLRRSELENKARSLGQYANAATAEEMDRIIARAWALHDTTDLHDFFLGT